MLDNSSHVTINGTGNHKATFSVKIYNREMELTVCPKYLNIDLRTIIHDHDLEHTNSTSNSNTRICLYVIDNKTNKLEISFPNHSQYSQNETSTENTENVNSEDADSTCCRVDGESNLSTKECSTLPRSGGWICNLRSAFVRKRSYDKEDHKLKLRSRRSTLDKWKERTQVTHYLCTHAFGDSEITCRRLEGHRKLNRILGSGWNVIRMLDIQLLVESTLGILFFYNHRNRKTQCWSWFQARVDCQKALHTYIALAGYLHTDKLIEFLWGIINFINQEDRWESPCTTAALEAAVAVGVPLEAVAVALLRNASGGGGGQARAQRLRALCALLSLLHRPRHLRRCCERGTPGAPAAPLLLLLARLLDALRSAARRRDTTGVEGLEACARVLLTALPAREAERAARVCWGCMQRCSAGGQAGRSMSQLAAVATAIAANHPFPPPHRRGRRRRRRRHRHRAEQDVPAVLEAAATRVGHVTRVITERFHNNFWNPLLNAVLRVYGRETVQESTENEN